MAIQQVKKQSDLEKRLRLLRQQVYGKTGPVAFKSQPAEDRQPKSPDQQTPVHTTDVAYLYRDLFKIGIFSSIALAVQIILFFLSKNHLLNLNFF